jgi:hypothetical protein
MAARGVYPGGWLTAGHNTWTYYLVSRPYVRTMQFLARLGLISGQIAEDDPDPEYRQAILAYALERFMQLAHRHNFTFVLFDPKGDYADAAAERAGDRLIYLGPDEAAAEVTPRLAKIPRERQVVPGDGHYTGEYMAVWADLLASRIAPLLPAM